MITLAKKTGRTAPVYCDAGDRVKQLIGSLPEIEHLVPGRLQAVEWTRWGPAKVQIKPEQTRVSLLVREGRAVQELEVHFRSESPDLKAVAAAIAAQLKDHFEIDLL